MHLIQLFPLSSSFDLQEIKIVVFPTIRKKYKLLKKTVYLCIVCTGRSPFVSTLF
jgi:hypothetical protein